MLTSSMKQLKMVQERFSESKESLQHMTPENQGVVDSLVMWGGSILFKVHQRGIHGQVSIV